MNGVTCWKINYLNLLKLKCIKDSKENFLKCLYKCLVSHVEKKQNFLKFKGTWDPTETFSESIKFKKSTFFFKNIYFLVKALNCVP